MGESLEGSLQLPVAISPCVRRFAVLCAIFALKTLSKENVVNEEILLLESSPLLQTVWQVNAPHRLGNFDTKY